MEIESVEQSRPEEKIEIEARTLENTIALSFPPCDLFQMLAILSENITMFCSL